MLFPEERLGETENVKGRIIRFHELDPASNEKGARDKTVLNTVADAPPPEDQTGEPLPKADPQTFPLLLNHERIFLTIFGLTALILFLVAQVKLSVRNAWILDLSFATIMTLMGIILSDNLVGQIKAIYAESLNLRINTNHLIKMLKLGGTRDHQIGFIVSVIYGTLLVTIGYKLRRELVALFGYLTKATRFILEPVVSVVYSGVSDGTMEFLAFAFTPVLWITVLGGLALFIVIINRLVSESVKSVLFLPTRYMGQIALAFHEIFTSIFKILYYILVTWKQFLFSCFLAIIKGLINLGNQHFVSGIQLDYLLYLKTVFAILGAAGYYVCFIRAYS